MKLMQNYEHKLANILIITKKFDKRAQNQLIINKIQSQTPSISIQTIPIIIKKTRQIT